VPESQNSEESFEKYWEWPDRLGNGFMYVTNFRPGLILGIGDYQLRKNIAVNSEGRNSPFVHIAFVVSGNLWSDFRYKHNTNDVCNLKSGQSVISYLPERMGMAKYPAKTRIRVVSIYIDTNLSTKIMKDQHDQIRTDTHDILEGAGQKHYYHLNNTTPAMNVAIHQILNCPYRGLLKRMYLESKTLELITHKLVQVVSPKCGLRNPSPLRPADIERIHEAKDILISNMQNPPSLFNLARQVGLNDTKLKRGFHQIFGTTVFGYLHAERMERGRQLLAEDRINVTEVSYEVGYSNRTHFTRAFTKHFGRSPLCYLQDTRKNISSTN
jgi:AraC-like DNA-binding protein